MPGQALRQPDGSNLKGKETIKWLGNTDAPRRSDLAQTTHANGDLQRPIQPRSKHKRPFNDDSNDGDGDKAISVHMLKKPKLNGNLGPSPNKRSYVDNNEAESDHPPKRTKVNDIPRQHDHYDDSSEIPAVADPSTHLDDATSSVLVAGPEITKPTLDVKVRHLMQKYNFSHMSILSSSKLESKVRNLLQHVENFSYVNTHIKPGIMVLHAKAGFASKLCSVVEIAKKAIAQDKGTWWQYNKLHGELIEQTPKSTKRAGGGKTLSEWEDQNRRGNERAKDALEGGQVDGSRTEEDVEMEDAFETMIKPKEQQSVSNVPPKGGSPKIRNTPILTVYFARVPVPGLKELFGEQTNSS